MDWENDYRFRNISIPMDQQRDRARLYICSRAQNAKDAEMLLETLGLIDDSRASDSHDLDGSLTSE